MQKVRIFSGRASEDTGPWRVRPEEIGAAVEAVRLAENRFNQVVEKELVDAACLELTAAKTRLNFLLRLARLQGREKKWVN